MHKIRITPKPKDLHHLSHGLFTDIIVISEEDMKNNCECLRGLRVNLILIPKNYYTVDVMEKELKNVKEIIKLSLTPKGKIEYY